MLVVLEGLDGAGKSTQVKKLKAYLEKICPELEYIHFPRYDAPVYGDLAQDAGFVATFAEALDYIWANGVEAAMQRYIARA